VLDELPELEALVVDDTGFRERLLGVRPARHNTTICALNVSGFFAILVEEMSMRQPVTVSLWIVWSGCSPELDGSQGHLCEVTSRTPLQEASHWTSLSEEEVSETLSRLPVRVDWDERTLDSESSPLSVLAQWASEDLVVIEQDCKEEPIFLYAPLLLQLDLGEGGVMGTLEGDLTVAPDGGLSIRAEGEARVTEPWASVGAAYVDEEQTKGELAYWRATVRGPWEQAHVGLDAVNLDAGGEDWVTSLWDGSWVLSEAAQP
jgi:hypothetical protein